MSWIKDESYGFDRSPAALRRFGFAVGLVILSIGSFLVWRDRGAGGPLVVIGATLLVAAALAPSSLKWIQAPWMMVSLAMGWVATRIILTTIFFLVITPIGLLQRLVRKSAIEVAFKADSASYWQRRPASPVPEDYEKQF